MGGAEGVGNDELSRELVSCGGPKKKGQGIKSLVTARRAPWLCSHWN